jgi:hypothetical protein
VTAEQTAFLSGDGACWAGRPCRAPRRWPAPLRRAWRHGWRHAAAVRAGEAARREGRP